ncbi:hypothetical protein RclHR1_03660014 [Rhizophagus clarus]|uniref:C2H2-type zinc finger transcription factor n=1 Tax=Rhizophagus clarus TaxID=94130 RepID=A0A2Z6RBN0_9GLOM|nr:hypothetical protein RclHR1_03660014 [Rhizophagus clarus]GES81865.1 C2H2-type zinc finger transcription factor [Rhizophagus clarus]
MSSGIHEYFKRKSADWNIRDFLEECNEARFQTKIDKYLKSLDTIVAHEQGKRKVKAEFLLQRYRAPPNSKVIPPDFAEARKWNNESRKIHIYQQTITKFNGNGNINTSAINGGTFITGLANKTILKGNNQEKDVHEESDDFDNFFKSPAEKISDERNGTNIEESEIAHELQDDDDSDLDTPDLEESVDYEGMKATDNKKLKENKNGPFRLNEEHRQIIEQTFNSMKKEMMWKLSTGRYVEEELFELGKKLEFEHAIHSFIIDVDDVITRQHFNKAELDEIDDAPGPQVPELSDEIVEFLNKFINKTSLNDIRKIIKEMMFDDNYNHEKDHDKDYILYALYSLVREIQSESLRDLNLEAWFNCHVWNAIFDQAFGDLKAISVVRGESSSLASSSRKNSKRQSGERRKIGRKGDWILRSISNGIKDEFGAGEAGKSWIDKNGTKVLEEKGLKLPKTLKDMLVKLMDKVDWDVEMCSKIQTVGMVHAGMMIMTVYMDNPKGYICRVRHDEPMEVSDNEENFSSILEILASVLNMKAAVRETMKVVHVKKQMKSFKKAGFRKRPLNENQNRLFSCLPTPKKAKIYVEANAEKSYSSSPCPGSL